MRVSAPNPLVSSVAPVGKSGRSRYCYRGAQELTRGGLESVSPRALLLVRGLSLNTRRDQRGGGEEGKLRATTTCLLMFLCATGKAREICVARGESRGLPKLTYRAVAAPRAGVEKGWERRSNYSLQLRRLARGGVLPFEFHARARSTPSCLSGDPRPPGGPLLLLVAS